MKENEETKKLNLDEFEALLNDITADCDRCEMNCRDRLRWFDSLIQSLRYQLAKALALNRVLLKAANLVAEDDYLEREIRKLTAKILQQEAKHKGPPDDDNQDEIEQELTHWN